MYSASQGRFRNVDLDIGAAIPLGALVPILESKLLILHSERTRGRSRVCAELKRQPKSAELAVASLVRVIRGLRGPAKQEWQRCSVRSLNIGYDAPKRFPALSDVLPAPVLRSAASVGVSIAITIYPSDDPIPPARTRRVKRRT